MLQTGQIPTNRKMRVHGEIVSALGKPWKWTVRSGRGSRRGSSSAYFDAEGQRKN